MSDWIVWSHNYSGQYKYQQNFIRKAEAPDGTRSVVHRFAMGGQFKGPKDCAGKVIKWKYQNIGSLNDLEYFSTKDINIPSLLSARAHRNFIK